MGGMKRYMFVLFKYMTYGTSEKEIYSKYHNALEKIIVLWKLQR